MKQLTTIYIIASMLLLARPAHAQWENTGSVRVDNVAVEWKPLIDIRMRVDLSDLEVAADHSVELIPLLQGDRDTLELPRVLVNGRTRHLIYKRERGTGYDQYQAVMRRRNGKTQSIDYVTKVPAQPWMDGAKLTLVADLCGCGWRSLDNRRLDVAQMESPKYEPLLAFMAPAEEKVKTRTKSGRAFLDFPVNRTEIYPNYRNNPRELRKIQATIDSVHTDKYATITDVSIKGYASPEGSYANNTRLARERAATLLEHVKGLYHFEGVNFSVEYEPEDWEGLDRMVSASGLADKQALLAIIRDPNITDPDVRDRELKRFKGGEAYRYLLQNFYPALRHSDYTVKYVIRNFTVDEAKQLLYTDPKQLSLDEMYRVALTYETGSSEYCEVFEIAVRMYPNDPVSNLNAANTALMRRDPAAARRYLAKAQPCKEKEMAEEALKQLEEYLEKTNKQ